MSNPIQLTTTAAIIVNYNMPERADALAEHIKKFALQQVDIFLVDNASDLMPPARNTNVFIDPPNRQTTRGWLAGLEAAQKHAIKDDNPYFAYWFLITSAEFVGECDPLTPLVNLLRSNEQVVGVHPALTPDSTTSWEHMKYRDMGRMRRTYFIDNIASLYRADWFDSIGGFDPELIYGWGIDLETCWKARMQHKFLYIHEGVQVRKTTDIAYTMERMRMSADERRRLAGENMTIVLSRKYGDNWRWKMYEEGVTDGLR